jgi:NAD(P)-dependent dehydrogenase (short-subunit alcohol dehydrogenase family)
VAERLAGQVVVITGGAGGIGRALAAAFTAHGARVALLDVDAAALESAASELQPRPRTVQCDVTDSASCARAIAAVVAEEGGVDVLVNNAGISHRSTFVDTSDEVLRRVMEVNFFGSVHCTRAALPSLLQRRGQVVVLSSVAGFAPLYGRTGYAASKHALHGFFDTLRAELAGTGVNVLLVCPSFIDTPLRRNATDGAGRSAGQAPVPVGGLLTPAQVADAVVAGCRARSRQLVLGGVGRLSFWVSRFAPRAYEALMRRSQKAEVK